MGLGKSFQRSAKRKRTLLLSLWSILHRTLKNPPPPHAYITVHATRTRIRPSAANSFFVIILPLRSLRPLPATSVFVSSSLKSLSFFIASLVSTSSRAVPADTSLKSSLIGFGSFSFLSFTSCRCVPPGSVFASASMTIGDFHRVGVLASSLLYADEFALATARQYALISKDPRNDIHVDGR
ncbi:hypothetical protein JI435_404170 [Parastagonospora nodorum SN15]|uniref:Uncharacterized protein n=1 Tax=Phaeosphaeria nodorum (strain SN15 / ATCC MYA-4574 / FGSC 10173) TaxID=321614 RepID=A0A7U2EZ60_PHANO|nr:hypothetical protein JI435_404170 [Parastagonospora nodorum SN15]